MIEWHNEKRKIKELVPYVSNPRQITEKQAEDLKKSLDKFGLAASLVINTDNTIIGGHQRKKIMETLMQMPPDFEIDVRVPERKLTDEEVKELNVRLNRNVAEWDFDALANNFELDDLLDWGFESGDLDLDLWMPEPPEDAEPQIDRAEELREVWGVETGQLWQLGEHRLICGDCTDKAVVERVMDIDCGIMVTDPPYGVEYDADWRNHALRENGNPIGGRAVGKVTNDDRADWHEAYDLFVGDVAYVWHAGNKAHIVAESLIASNFEIVSQIIWAKNNLVIGRGNYHPKHEPCWYVVRSGGERKFTEDRTQTTLWEIDKPHKSETGHSTQKPIECMERPIRNHNFEAVYDPFVGSGTTLIACERLNRKCRAVEISEKYCAVAIQRWVDVTGGEPVLVE